MKSIMSTTHDLVKYWVKLQQKRSFREEEGRVLVEGKNLIQDLLKKKNPERLILTEKMISQFPIPDSCEVIMISDEVAKKISDVSSPEGCFAEYVLPRKKGNIDVQRALVLDRLQDPGNLGTLFRTALSFGFHDVILIEPSCDPWNPKVIRSGKGAQFSLSVWSSSWDEVKKLNKTIYVADTTGESAISCKKDSSFLLVLGNEAQGPSIPEDFSFQRVHIPMKGDVESLNVAQAGAILLFLFQ